MALTASQRVTVIKEVSRRLSAEEWPFIDLTLKQFGLPWSDDWQGSRDAYLLQMIGEASDDGLLALAQHVGYEPEAARVGVDPPFWRKDHLRLFLSHLAAHRAYAADLQEALLPYGISAFVAHNDIEPTAEWQTEIETALATCDALVALLHPSFHASNWTDQEIGFAMGRGLPVFSVRYGQDPYGFIGRLQAFNGNRKKASDLARELFDVLRAHKQTQRRMASVLIALFEASGSFATAKERLSYLEELETWDPSFSKRLKTAVDANSQVSGAWGVPDGVERLVKAWRKRGV